MRFHQPDQRGQAVAAHHAVGIEHDHVAILLAPTAAEVGHVAGLAARAQRTPAIEDPPASTRRVDEFVPRGRFGGAQVGIVGIGEDEEIEQRRCAGGRERFAGGAQAGEHGWHVLIADRHDDRSACSRIDRPVLHGGRRHAERVTAARECDESNQAGPEAGQDPRGQQPEQAELQPADPLAGIGREAIGKDVGRKQRGQHDQPRQRDATVACGFLPRLRQIGRSGRGLAGAQPAQPGDERPRLPRPRDHGSARERRITCRRGHNVARGVMRRLGTFAHFERAGSR